MNTTRGDEIAHWVAAMRAEGHSPRSITRRVGTVRAIQRDTGQPLAQLNVDRIAAWLAPFRSATRQAYYGDLAAYFRWMQRTDRMKASPLVGLRRPKTPKRRPRPVHTDELMRALDTAQGDVRTWILLGAYQGLRSSEATAMRGEFITGQGLRVFGKGDSDKVIPVHPLVTEAARRYPTRGWWFPGHGRRVGYMMPAGMSIRVQNHFASIGVTMTFHQLRHWCGTEMLRKGADLRQVQEFLRHESVTSTALYTEVLQDDLTAAMLRLPGTPPLSVRVA